LVGTQHFVCWVCSVVVAKCHLDGQPAFILVATWHLLWWAASVFLVTTWLLRATWKTGEHQTIFFVGYVAFW